MKQNRLAQATSNQTDAVRQLLAKAVTCHQSGQTGQAEALYQQILAVQPWHFDALHLLGVIAAQSARFAEAVELIGRAIRVNPKNPDAHFNHGNALLELKRYREAQESFGRAITLRPNHPAAYWKRGLAMQNLPEFKKALACFDRAIALKADYADAYNSRGAVLIDLGRYDCAVTSLDRAIANRPDYAAAYYHKGIALNLLGRYESALASFDRAISLQPNLVDCYISRGETLQNLKLYDMAMLSVEQAIALQPDMAEAYYNRGILLTELKQFEAAIESFTQAIALKPDYAEAYHNLGLIHLQLEQYPAALKSLDEAIALKPGYADAYSNHGLTCIKLKQYEAALASLTQAAALKPGCAETCFNLGGVLQKLERYQEAVTSYEQAIARKPDYAMAYNNYGNTLQHLGQHNAALECFNKAAVIQPDYAEAYYNLGLSLNALHRYPPAVNSFEQAIALKPDYADAFNHRGLALYQMGQYQAALASYAQVIALNPDYNYIYGQCLQTRLQLCDWEGIEQELAEFAEKAGAAEKIVNPFTALALTDSALLQQKIAEVWTQDQCANKKSQPEFAGHPPHAKLRVAYFSADFHIHPVAILTAELFEKHDSSRFEIFAFSLCSYKDTLTTRLEAAFDRFIEVQDLSDPQIVQLARELEIDIAVDLGGHTGNARTGVFALRVAPLQVSYLGFAGTLGADYMDYLIADKTVIPAASRSYYTEKIAYLPHSYFVNDTTRKISGRPVTRAEFGLPESGFVFCCFNNTFKLNPTAFAGWMRILAAVENSVLWLFEGNSTAGANLKQAARQHGVDADRLVFAERLPQIEDHLARQSLADLFLDTLPFNAHTTACDALWAGLPVLTCPGENFASRVAASQLNAIGLPELIAETPAQYEALAIELATNPEKLAGIKAKLAQNRLSTPLFDTGLFTSHLEAAYTKMYDCYQAGLPPEHIDA
jgi:predicted O-linked N-acetylglucosamine transferase (SPINDLY family)